MDGARSITIPRSAAEVGLTGTIRIPGTPELQAGLKMRASAPAAASSGGGQHYSRECIPRYLCGLLYSSIGSAHPFVLVFDLTG